MPGWHTRCPSDAQMKINNFARRFWNERGLINTTDLLVATVATVTLAAGVGSAMIGSMDEARYGKAQPDAGAGAGGAVSEDVCGGVADAQQAGDGGGL